MQQLRLAVLELLLVVDGDLLLDHHLLLLEVDLLLLNQGVGLDLCVGGYGTGEQNHQHCEVKLSSQEVLSLDYMVNGNLT